ncbi:MAG: MipA/OmpV family protein [Burkholderiaceae bacterium]|nr:MipA/OmpV family protein [Burkholderiaceae bacterium]
MRSFYKIFLGLMLATQLSLIHAQDVPKWEAGIGMSTLHLPDYRGSNETHSYVLPIPYFVYRGDKIKVDRQGIRGELFNTDFIQLDISAGASVPVNSDKNLARAGMPNLDGTAELGPSLEITLARSRDRRTKLDLRIPVRMAFTLGPEKFGQNIGLVATPHLNLDVKDIAGMSGWNLGVLGGLSYGSARNHGYFYNIAREYASASRPAYTARGGYGGNQLILALSKRFNQYWLGAFLRADSLKGAVFENSPLIKTKKYVTAGIGFSWIFKQSEQSVQIDD